ncbi:MAG TPA: NRDE family protein [Noviherbaspirillum sp.]|nr:NRDE family protein [Noviherbaspirillum sp.]
MCLIVFAWQVVPGISLVAAGNRDEFFDRPAAPAGWWDDQPQIYGGRDLQAGGTWMGITRDGRFAAITNVRAPSEKHDNPPSRGALVADYLKQQVSPQEYIEQITPNAEHYNGFNLLLGDHQTLIWFSNRAQDDARNGKPLPSGIYGLSNGMLDAPWPKVVRTKAQFGSLLCQGAPEDAYFEMLADTTQASDCRLPRTGVNIEWERILSAVCIESPEYGTRSSTIVRLYADGSAALDERIVR